MVNRFDSNIARTPDSTSNASLKFSSPLSLRSTDTESFSSDELIRSLSDAYENKRARQVFEWERTRRRNADVTFI